MKSCELPFAIEADTTRWIEQYCSQVCSRMLLSDVPSTPALWWWWQAHGTQQQRSIYFHMESDCKHRLEQKRKTNNERMTLRRRNQQRTDVMLQNIENRVQAKWHAWRVRELCAINWLEVECKWNQEEEEKKSQANPGRIELAAANKTTTDSDIGCTAACYAFNSLQNWNRRGCDLCKLQTTCTSLRESSGHQKWFQSGNRNRISTLNMVIELKLQTHSTFHLREYALFNTMFSHCNSNRLMFTFCYDTASLYRSTASGP